MAEQNPPLALQTAGIQHPAALYRRAFEGVIGNEGTCNLNAGLDLKVVQSSPAGMSVRISAGGAFVKGDDVGGQGVFFVYNDTYVTKTVPAAHATLARKDIVVAEVNDATSGQTGDNWVLTYIEGTAGGSPSPPATPLTALRLAVVNVPAAVSSITDSNIEDTRIGIGSSAPVGATIPFAGTTAPAGWLIADGSAVSRTTYSTLFAHIGTAWGVGDGSTTFNLPNLKGRTPVGYDASQSEFNAVGKTGGAKTHTLITGELPSHNHPMQVSGAINNIGGGSGSQRVLQTDSGLFLDTNNRGSDQAHNNLQPFAALNFIIKA